MNDALLDKRLRLLEGTYIAALVSVGIFLISSQLPPLDAQGYLFLLFGAALIASPLIRLHTRIVKYTAARRGASYIGFALIALPASSAVVFLGFGYFVWLGVSSGITTPGDELLTLMGVLIGILTNLGVLIYNLVEFRQ